MMAYIMMLEGEKLFKCYTRAFRLAYHSARHGCGLA